MISVNNMSVTVDMRKVSMSCVIIVYVNNLILLWFPSLLCLMEMSHNVFGSYRFPYEKSYVTCLHLNGNRLIQLLYLLKLLGLCKVDGVTR